MTIVKTDDLIGPALRWAVAKAEYADGRKIVFMHGHSVGVETAPGCGYQFIFRPDEDWSQGGPIIEREHIGTLPIDREDNWRAFWAHNKPWVQHRYVEGPTPLIAAMRCFVASKLGDTVDVPSELMQ